MHCRGEPARPSYFCDDVRPTHDNSFEKTHITKHSINFTHPIRADRPAPTWSSPDVMDFVSGE